MLEHLWQWGRVLCLVFWGIISDFLFLGEPLLGKTHSSNYLAYSSYIAGKPKKKKKKKKLRQQH